MGKCKGCGKPIITWWGSRCWVCTGKHVALTLAAQQDTSEERALAAARRERRNRRRR